MGQNRMGTFSVGSLTTSLKGFQKGHRGLPGDLTIEVLVAQIDSLQSAELPFEKTVLKGVSKEYFGWDMTYMTSDQEDSSCSFFKILPRFFFAIGVFLQD